MPFDPNKFLTGDAAKATQGGFDPNAFLGGSAPAAPGFDPAAFVAGQAPAARQGEPPVPPRTESTIGPADPQQAADAEKAALAERFAQLPRGERIARTLSRQVKEGITPQLISAAARLGQQEQAALDRLLGTNAAANAPDLTIQPSSPLDAQASNGLVSDLVTGGVAMMADPVAHGVFGLAGKAVKSVPFVGRLFSSAAELAAERQAAAYAVKTVGEVAEDSYRAAARRYALNRLGRSVAEGSAEFGAYNATTEAARQLNEQDFDPLNFTAKTLEGTVFGAGLGALTAPLRSAGGELFAGSRRAVTDGRLKQLAEEAKNPRYVEALGAQSAELAKTKAGLEEQLSGTLGKLDEVTKSKLQQRLDSVSRQLRDLSEPVAPEAPHVLDAAAQRAAAHDAELESLRAQRASIDAQRTAIHTDPNRLVFSGDDLKLLAKLDKQAPALDAKILAREAALERASSQAEKGLSRFQSLEKQHAVALDAHNSELERLLVEKDAIERGLSSNYLSVEGGGKPPESVAAGEIGQRVIDQSARLAEVEQQIAATQVSKAESLSAYRNFMNSTGPLSLKERLASRYETRPQFLDRALNFADSEAQKLVDRGVIKPEQKNGFAQGAFLEIIEKKQLPIGKSGVPRSSWVRAFTQRTELFNTADKALGTRLVDSHYALMQAATTVDHWNVDEAKVGHRLLQRLEKRGLTGAEITHLLTHTESTPLGVVFNPDAVASKALTRSAYVGSVPAEQVLRVYPELVGVRQELDRLIGLATDGERRAVGYVPGYVRLQPRAGSAPKPASSASLESILNPSAYKERFEGRFDPTVHEDNPHVWFQSYVRQINRDRAFSPLLPDVFRQITLATLLGDKSGTAAEEFASTVAQAMGLNRKAALAEKFAQQLAAGNEAAIRAVMQKADLPPSAFDEVVTGLKNVLYESQVVLKLKNAMLDYLQPYLIGSAEVGAKWITKAYNAVAFNKAQREFAKSFDHELLGADAAITHELGVTGPQTKVGQTIQKVISLPGRVSGLRRFQGATEGIKRRVTFLAGYMQFKDAAEKGGGALIDSAMDGLLEGERSRVLRIYREHGPEAAAQAYGIIRSYRSNFALSAMNKPDILTSKLGSLIPFTTWSANQLARVVTDVRRTHGFSHGIDWLTGERTAPTGTGQLVGRVAKAFAVLALIRAATGQDIPSAHPVGDIGRAFEWQMLPALTQPLSTLNRTGSPKAALGQAVKQLPGVYQVDQYHKRLERTGSRTSALLGTDPVRGTPVQRALDPLRKLLRGEK